MDTTGTTIEFTRVNNDVNGNPRYVCHFLNLITDKDEAQIDAHIKDLTALSNGLSANYSFSKVEMMYREAVKKARKIGGKKFHNRQYGGGIVFQSYNVRQLGLDILELNK